MTKTLDALGSYIQASTSAMIHCLVPSQKAAFCALISGMKSSGTSNFDSFFAATWELLRPDFGGEGWLVGGKPGDAVFAVTTVETD